MHTTKLNQLVTQRTMFSSSRSKLIKAFSSGLIFLTIAACSDNDNSLPQVSTPPPAPEVPAPNITSVSFAVSAKQQFPPISSAQSVIASIDFNVDDSTLVGMIDLQDLTANMAHIHSGFAGENGDVLFAFEPGQSANTFELPETQLDDETLARLLDGGLYINVHTDEFPAGEMRAQVLVNDTKVRVFDISPVQQVPQLVSPASGTGYITLNQEDDLLLLNVSTTIDDPILAAHIHMGTVGSNGDPIVNLMPLENDQTILTSDVQAVDQDFIDAILADDTYVNLHTEAFPGGELRGQIVTTKTQVKSFVMDSLQATTQYSQQLAQGYSLVNTETSELLMQVNFTGFENPTSISAFQSDDNQYDLNIAENGESATFSGELSAAEINSFAENQWTVTATNQSGDVIQGKITDNPTTTGYFLDPQSFIADSNEYTINFDGDTIGSAIINISIETGADNKQTATIEEITDAVPFGIVETLTVTVDPLTGAAKTYTGTGVSQGREIDIDLAWNKNQLTGSADYSAEAVSHLLPGIHAEQLALFYSMHAMPLAENLEMPLEVFNALDGSLLTRTLQVQAIEDVTVAAGTFETYRVFLADGPVNQIFYISTEIPRKLIQIGFEGIPFTYELQPL